MYNGGFSSRGPYRRDEDQSRGYNGQSRGNFGGQSRGNFGGQSRGNFGGQIKRPNWDEMRLDIIDRNHYQESQAVADRSSKDIKKYYGENEITVNGRPDVRPVLNFSELILPHALSRRLAQQKFTKPTVIQSVAVPIAISGHNLVGIAQTGSGKTLAYLLPAFDHISRMPSSRRGDGPIVLILVPTRELAQQVQSVATDMSMGYKVACVYGGADRRKQMRDVSEGVQICVATPGRLIDFLEQNIVDLKKKCSMLIMDEADRMLDLGFEPQIRVILGQIRPDRHLLMFSATWPKAVHRLVDDFMKSYHHITIGNPDICSNHNITQIVEVVNDQNRDHRFQSILGSIMEETLNKTLVFCETKRKTDEVSWNINQMGFKSASIHGDKSQMERERILRDFKGSRLTILVATDVASRGLDVQDIKYVVNYDFPNCTEDYIHRIGRTGRAERSGTSYTLLTPKHFRQARDLIKILREANQEVPRDLLSVEGNSYGGNNRGGQNRGMQRNNYSRWGPVDRNGDGEKRQYRSNEYEPAPKRQRQYDDRGNNSQSFFMPPPPPQNTTYRGYNSIPMPPGPPPRGN